MPNIRGTFATSNFETGIKKLDVSDKIYELQPDATPYFQLVGRTHKKVTVDTVFYWFEDDLMAMWTTVGAAYNNSVTTITLADTTFLVPSDLIKNLATGEIMRVTAINSSTSINVTRGWGTTPATAGSVGDYMLRLAPAIAEGAVIPEALVTEKVRKQNYVQFFQKVVSITATAAAVETYGGDRRNFERRKKAVELKRDIEAQFLFGEPKEDLTGSKPIRQTGGFFYFINTQGNILNLNNNPLTESAFEEWLKDMFTYSDEDLWVLAGPKPLKEINGWAREALQTSYKDKTYGITFHRYLSAMGVVNLVLSRQFIGPNANKLIGVRPNELYYRHLKGRDWTLKLDVSPENVSSHDDVYELEIGFELHHPKLHGAIINIG